MNFIAASILSLVPIFTGTTELKVKTDAVKIEFIGDKETAGTISGFQATINFDANDLANSSISGTVDANTLNTDNAKRDEHLKSADYFETKTYPTMGFKSSSIAVGENSSYVMTGMMTIKGVEHEETITFSFADNTFKGTSTIKLAHYKVGSYANRKPDDTKVKIRFTIPVM